MTTDKAASKPRILLVEDDVLLRKVLRLALESAFDSVHVAHDGNAALEALANQHFDLVLTDLKIPAPDGLALALEARRQVPPPAVVVMSGDAGNDDALRIGACGASLLSKPFDTRELLLVLESVLAQRADDENAPKRR